MSRYVVNGPSSFAVRGRAHECEWARCEHPAGKSRRSRRRWLAVLVGLLVAFAAWQLGGAVWIHTKAVLAQHLIASAWSGAKGDGARRPWPWADTRPVARLAVPSHGIFLYVLSETSGRSLAFGPGHLVGTALPGTAGNSVIVAHRDTHFAFLRDLRENEEITVEDVRGRITRYRVREAAVVDKHDTRLLDPADSPQLTLITCWPFDAVRPGSTERYVVIADRA